MSKLLKYLKFTGSDERLDVICVFVWISFVGVVIQLDLVSLILFSLLLVSYHWEKYFERKQNQSDELRAIFHQVSELEGKVSQMSLVSAFKGGKYGS